MPSPEKEIIDTTMGAPHVVILGAGASVATCPNGDLVGNRLPVMDNLMDTLELRQVFNEYKIDVSSENFEEIYSNIYEDSKYSELTVLIEKRVIDYFSQLTLPNHPTIYDHLLLSLRSKDVVATFNWDPLLYSAYCRNYKKAPLPHILHLHGNVAIGCCHKDKVKTNVYAKCFKCGNRVIPSQLLFPIKRKNYTADLFINSEWETLKACLSHAYILTIFGYGAPTSDVEAISLMKEAWGPVEKRNLEEIEIIDIKNSDCLVESWKNFIHTHHYRTTTSFYNSYIAEHPRRTCEAMWSCLMMLDPYQDNKIPVRMGFKELHDWYLPLIDAETSQSQLEEKH